MGDTRRQGGSRLGRSALLRVLALAAALTIAAPVVQSVTIQAADAAARQYRVRAGDTLLGVAAKFGVSVESLVARNRIGDPNRMVVGQVLLIERQTGGTGLPAALLASPARLALRPTFRHWRRFMASRLPSSRPFAGWSQAGNPTPCREPVPLASVRSSPRLQHS